jgi:hypothetical protein
LKKKEVFHSAVMLVWTMRTCLSYNVLKYVLFIVIKGELLWQQRRKDNKKENKHEN